MSRSDIGVVMLAAGRGVRMGIDIPKPYLPLRDKPILRYSLDKFVRNPRVSEIVFVIHPDDRELLKSRVLDGLDASVPVKIVLGGEHRQDSAQAGVRAVRSEWVAVHDGVRPFFSAALFESVVEAARAHRVALPALPVEEAVKSVDESGFVWGEVEREALYLAQTPQCFDHLLLDRALDDAEKRALVFADEAGVVLAIGGIKPKIVPGERTNVKITTPADLDLAEALIKAGLAG